ncbi:hypothetical protein CCACVL1_05350 [Corchorus capsularis]|uniref:Uncharacterized protein n=1 Tax=Corchorus capsularis TaxID=210143 RepID=A0A1R3JLC1_COCAP|nr:hypothetical protein CCACVL1_05350 [Corchorus capsularis]
MDPTQIRTLTSNHDSTRSTRLNLDLRDPSIPTEKRKEGKVQVIKQERAGKREKETGRRRRQKEEAVVVKGE